jgi:hypothetical protein
LRFSSAAATRLRSVSRASRKRVVSIELMRPFSQPRRARLRLVGPEALHFHNLVTRVEVGNEPRGPRLETTV